MSTGVALETSAGERKRDWFIDLDGLHLTCLELFPRGMLSLILTLPAHELLCLFLHYCGRDIQIVLFYLSSFYTSVGQ